MKNTDTYNNAAEILSGGAKALLQAGQGGSGGDLALMLLNDVYMKGEWEVNAANKQRLFDILKLFPSEEPTRKRFVQEMVGWSAKYGDLETGDPEVHHVVGKIYASENNTYDAERHLVLGTSNSPEPLADLTYLWYTSDSPHTAALYCSRCVFPYLIVGNLSSANKAYSTFTSLLTSKNPSLFTQSVSSSKSDMRVFPSLPLLNFLGLLLLSCQKGQSSLFKELAKHYSSHLKEKEVGETWGWNDALANIGEIWFAIRIPRQGGNPLMDMMGSMLFGGGGGSPAAGRPGTPSSKQSKPEAAKKVEASPQQAPPTMDLD